MGKLIVLEGLDGSGKSTQQKLLLSHLEKQKIPYVAGHFPDYDTPTGKVISRYLAGELLGTDIETMNPYIIHGIYAVDRAVNFDLKYHQPYKEGKWIIFDCYTTSSLIFQGAEFKTDREKIAFVNYATDLEFGKYDLPVPNKVVFLDTDPEIAQELMKKREQNPGVLHDIHEVNLDYQKRVRETALLIAEQLGWSVIPVLEDNHYRTIPEIHQDVLSYVKK